jgi:hypothetical protein
MDDPATRGQRLLPWAGLLAAPLAAALQQNLGSVLVPIACQRGSGLPVVLLGVACLAIVAVGGLLSWRGLRQTDRAGRRFLAMLSMAVAGLLALAVVAQAASGFVFSGCER